MKVYHLTNVEEVLQAPRRWWNVQSTAKHTEIEEFPNRTPIKLIEKTTPKISGLLWVLGLPNEDPPNLVLRVATRAVDSLRRFGFLCQCWGPDKYGEHKPRRSAVK